MGKPSSNDMGEQIAMLSMANYLLLGETCDGDGVCVY